MLLALVALVSLVVGGIGVMNIMLVSVAERTREIGIRLAIGARMHDILTQFLMEAVVLSTLGGVAGIVVSVIAVIGLGALLDWSMTISPVAVTVAIGVSSLAGVIFGFVPAWRAARLDPIEALRHE